jgi:LacI family transcriptional regulator
MLQGIRSVLGSANLSILMGCPPPGQSEDQAEQEFLQAALVNPQVAGVIVWEMYSNECRRLYSELVDKGVAVVFIDRAPAFPVAADFVGTDNVGAAKEAVNHLIRLGHKRISIVLRDHVASSVQDRLQGYRLALSDANIPFDQGLVVDYPCDPAIPVQVRMESLLKDLLAQRDPATAIFAINDSIALHLLEAARSLGVKAPDRLSILGFDWLLRNLPMGGELTTVAQPFEEIGQTAAQRLIERIREAELSLGTSSTPRKILFQAPLVIRNSTGRAHLPG